MIEKFKTNAEVIENGDKYLYGNHVRMPISMERGEGVYVFDKDGNKYLDFVGGIAVNGHIAFNEPEPEMTNEQFAQLPTRVEKLSQATLLKDAIMGRGGAIDTVPKQAVTVGMKEMLGARKLRLTMMADMQRAVIRRAGYGEVTASFPVSFAQTHPDAKIIISRNVAEKPF